MAQDGTWMRSPSSTYIHICLSARYIPQRHRGTTNVHGEAARHGMYLELELLHQLKYWYRNEITTIGLKLLDCRELSSCRWCLPSFLFQSSKDVLRNLSFYLQEFKLKGCTFTRALLVVWYHKSEKHGERLPARFLTESHCSDSSSVRQ